MRHVLSACFVAAAIGLAGCGGASMGPTGTGGGTQNPPGSGGSTSNAVTVGNDFFNPANTTVAVGTVVTWTWNSSGVAHNIVFDDGAPGSGVKSSGSFSRTFSTAGTYTYFCSIHGRAVMSGSITVQ